MVGMKRVVWVKWVFGVKWMVGVKKDGWAEMGI